MKMMKAVNLKDKGGLVNTGITVLYDHDIEYSHKLGIAHFWEHMAFKGTTTRSEKEIIHAVESRGGHFNAYTSQTEIVFYITGPAEHQLVFEEILLDIVWNSNFPTEEINKERRPILEELRMSEDDPWGYIVENFEIMTSLESHPILGTEESINSIDGESLLKFKNDVLSQPGCVFPWSSKVWKTKYSRDKSTPLGGRTINVGQINATAPKRKDLLKDGISSSYVIVGSLHGGLMDPKIENYIMTANELGGGFSSPLFQRIREELGMAYQVASQNFNFAKFGAIIALAICDKQNVETVINEMIEIICKEHPVTDRSRNMSKSGMMSSMQKVERRMGDKNNEFLSKPLDLNKLYSIERTVALNNDDLFVITLTPKD